MALDVIVLFMPPRSQYGTLHHFTKKFAEAFLRQGVQATILEAQKDNPKLFLDQLTQLQPDATLSFNGLLPDLEGRFLSDMIQVPHIACLVDSPNLFIPLKNSSLNIITCIDRFHTQFFRGLGAKNTFFLPHAVEPEIFTSPKEERSYDVTLFGSFVDCDALRATWKQKFSSPLRKLVENAAEKTLVEDSLSPIAAFVDTLQKQNSVNPSQVEFIEAIDEIECWITAKARIELLKEIEDVSINLFGAGTDHPGWKKWLGKKVKNLRPHPPITFDQAIEVFKKSRISLNSCPKIREGGHERIFSGIACGSLVITESNRYLREQFIHDKELMLYPPTQLNCINEMIHTHLNDEEKRQSMVKAAQKKVLAQHTWDQRAEFLLRAVPPLLKR